MTMQWSFQSATQTGGRDVQQDRLDVLHCKDHNVSLAILADGVGGYGNGEQAAQLLEDTAKDRFTPENIVDPETFFSLVCKACHNELKSIQKTTGVLSATTCVMLLIKNDEAHWTHVGDSRLYHFRNNDFAFKTRDHTLCELDDHELESLGFDCDSSIDTSQVYMCLGGKNDIHPEFGISAIDDQDSFMLCSDGIWGAFHPLEIAKMVNIDTGSDNFAEILVNRAVERNGVTSDNTSMIFASPRRDKSSSGRISRLLSAFRWPFEISFRYFRTFKI